MAKIVRAEKQNWLLLEKIGSGDAGEVWRVEAETSHQRAVLKRPVQNVSGGTMLRQARQIEAEGQILADLDGVDVNRNGIHIHTPLLIDRSQPGTSGTSGLFMISEEVSGVSITAMLDKLRQGQSAFSQVLTLKVLAAAFHLLRQAHAKGILWNDVKTDHIFWDETNHKMSFIDWGNGLRFDSNNPNEQVNPSLDFQQLVNEGRQLLTQISPDLIQDLSWPLTMTGLTDLDIFHLQMRVEYLENHLAMRVTEYRLLFEKYLDSSDNVQNLYNALELKKALERLGVQLETSQVLQIAKKLWLTFLEENNAETSYQLIQTLEENLPLPPNWQLAIYFFKALQPHQHETLITLIEPVLEENWSEAMWAFSKSFASFFSTDHTTNILSSMRNIANIKKDMSIIIPEMLIEIRQNLQQALNRLKASQSIQDDLLSQLNSIDNQLSAIQTSWSVLGENEAFGEKLLKTREVLSSLTALGMTLPPSCQTQLTTLLSKSREIYRAWANAELDQTKKLLRDLFMLDPTLTYLLPLDDEIQKTKDWVETLKTGPQGEQSINQFGSKCLSSFPLAHQKLGAPGWLNAMYTTANILQKCQDIDELRKQLKQIGMPLAWADYNSLKLEYQAPSQPVTSLNPEQEKALTDFHQSLASSANAKVYLDKVKNQLPQYTFLYTQLYESYQNAWLLHPPKQSPLEWEVFPKADQPRVRESIEVLNYIKYWRDMSQSRAFGFSQSIPQTSQKWQILEEMSNASKLWQETILPTLSKIKQKDWDFPASQNPQHTPYPDLSLSLQKLSKLHTAWKNIENQGIFPESLTNMSAYATQAQSLFYKFWQSLENNNIAPHRWLAIVNQPIFSEINQNLLLIMRQLLGVARSLDVINNPDMARTRLALTSAGEIMFNLVRLNDLVLAPSRGFNLFRHWHQQYLHLIQEGNVQRIRENIESIESIHPLLPWLDELLRRDTDYFKVPDQQRW